MSSANIEVEGVDVRNIEVGADNKKLFCDNSVETAKYGIFTFLPRALLEQFQKVANLYFLCICILMIIGTFTDLFDSPLSPWSTLVVLCVVIIISLTRNAIEDIERHKADAAINNREAVVWKPTPQNRAYFQATAWKDVIVGDIVRVQRDEEMPADLILIASAEADGIAFVETANIDGETNLKLKKCAHHKIFGRWRTIDDVYEKELIVHCEPPNSIIQHFNGSMFINGREVGLDMSNFLLRGSTLRNTKWVFGVVVYTGKDTKLIMNSRRVPFKLSSIERTMNNIILVILAAQVLISVISATTYYIWTYYHYYDLNYLCYDPSRGGNTVYETFCDTNEIYSSVGYFFSFFILYSNFVPISLYVTVDICNFLQAFFIDHDLTMFEEETNTPALARTSNMNSDLGMIEYIFSDKTGTLTDNVMRFRRCSVAGTVYGDPPEDAEGAPLDDETRARKATTVSGVPIPSLYTAAGDVDSPAGEFALVLAVCHTVIIEDEKLQSESPDEEALVKATKELGWEFVGRRPGVVMVEREGQRMEYELLATIPFDSTRKRMSTILRRPNGSMVVYCKGADNIIFERSVAFVNPEGEEHRGVDPKALLNKHLNLFGGDGLRTLVLAKRELTARDFTAFEKLWTAAEKAINGRVELMAEAAALVECELTVLGATAIEDKLQKGVPQTIQDLRNAGIKLWVLTGDKLETAVNIGYSAKILTSNMVLIKLKDNGEDANALKKKLHTLLLHFQKIKMDSVEEFIRWTELQRSFFSLLFHYDKVEARHNLEIPEEWNVHADGAAGGEGGEGGTGTTNGHSNGHASAGESTPLIDKPPNLPSLDQISSDHLALIVDGDTLIKVFGDPVCERMFLSLSLICRSVIACRVSPEQKRLLVRLVKRGVQPTPVTLSIGDGANDVAMIQEAQVGIGISGKEGRQAVNASDFAIPQFRFLKRLLLIHGRTDYRRTCKVVLYSFYKNIVLSLVEFFFTFYSAYSGQSLFDDSIHSAYNLILAWPVIAFGVFDRDISELTLLKYPFLYISGRKKLDLNLATISINLLLATIDALLIYYISYYCYYEPKDIWGSHGYTEGIWVFGTTVYTCLVAAMFVRCAQLTNTWTWISHLCFWISIICYVVFLIGYQYWYEWSYNYYGVTNEMMGHATFWLLLFLIPVTTGQLMTTLELFRKELFPTVVDFGIEFDRGEGKSTLWEDIMRTLFNKSSADLMQATEANLNELTQQISKILIFGMEKFPMNWGKTKSFWSSMNRSEQQRLGVSNPIEQPEEQSSYNYDHVSSGYNAEDEGYVHISNNLLFPKKSSDLPAATGAMGAAAAAGAGREEEEEGESSSSSSNPVRSSSSGSKKMSKRSGSKQDLI